MKSIEENEFLINFCKKHNIEIPNNFKNMKIYEEIENFKDAEYIYCIAYEMLIRTNEYKALLNEYKPLKNKSKNDMTNDEFLKLRKLIDRMNALGLKKTSFLGFDCDDDNDHVFKRIEYYDEIINTPWNVRMLHKFESDSDENIFYQLAKFYFEKGKLYKLINSYYYPISTEAKELVIDYIKNKSLWKTQEECKEFYSLLDDYYIPCTSETTDTIKYKSLSSNTIYLSELDKDFLLLLKEKKSNNLFIQTKSDFSDDNIEFWNKYTVNDIKDGLKKLIEFHIHNNLIYNQNNKHINTSLDEILRNPSNFYIPCVNRLSQPELFPWEKSDNLTTNNEFIKQLEFNGIKSIVGDKGYVKINKEKNIYLMQICEYISLNLIDDSFLKTLTYEDLKNTYINTEPLFSRPRLMFDEARLTNIPINLNLSKEDLLLYITQIKNDYDRNKNIVKTEIEYFFNLTLESDTTKIPSNIKYANEKRNSNDKKLLPKKREDFKTSFTSAFYIYDLYKFFIRLFEIKKKCIRRQRNFNIKEIKEDAKKKGDIICQNTINEVKESAEKEIKNYEINNLITQISYLVTDLSEEQIEYYLTTMKEFIHGVNLIGERNNLKKVNNSKKYEKTDPKYKDLIIGNSYIIKSNKEDLIKKLID